MQNINTLIQENLIMRSCEFLKDKGIKEHNFEKPMYPACIFYLGKASEEFYSEMNNDLIRGWGGSARHIRHFKALNPDNFFESLYDMEDNKKTAAAVQSDITDMMGDINVFRDMNYIHMYFILETRSLTPEEFAKWYACVSEIGEKIAISKRTFLITILDQSLDNVESSVKIREKLLELYVSNELSDEHTHLYDSVFLFSNRLKNGQFIKLNGDSQEYKDYNLFADIILLSNTDNDELNNRISKLCNKHIPAFTAAYSNLSKPLVDIVMITLKKCLTVIRQSINNIEDKIAAYDNLIPDLLGIKSNRLHFADQIFNEYISAYVSNTEPLKYLPCEYNVIDMRYKEADNATMGCLSQFVAQNYFTYIDKFFRSNMELLKQRLKTEILERMNFEQQNALSGYKGDIKNEVQGAISRLMFAPNPSECAVGDYIGMICKNRVKECLIPLAQEIIVNMKKNMSGSLSVFTRLYEAVELMNTTGNGALGQNMHNFYESIVDEYYNTPKKADMIIKKMLTECGDESEMVDALRVELEHIFSDNSIFSASFVDELISRLEALGTGINVGALITKELVEQLDNRLALNSYNVFNERFFEAYFLNTAQNSVYNALVQKAKSHHIPVTYYNTLSNDMVESVWFYKCTEDNIRI